MTRPYQLEDWAQRRKLLFGEDHYRQKLISAGFGTVFPSLDEVREALVVIYAKRLKTIEAVAEKLKVAPSTLRRWIDRWENT